MIVAHPKNVWDTIKRSCSSFLHKNTCEVIQRKLSANLFRTYSVYCYNWSQIDMANSLQTTFQVHFIEKDSCMFIHILLKVLCYSVPFTIHQHSFMRSVPRYRADDNNNKHKTEIFVTSMFHLSPPENMALIISIDGDSYTYQDETISQDLKSEIYLFKPARPIYLSEKYTSDIRWTSWGGNIGILFASGHVCRSQCHHLNWFTL